MRRLRTELRILVTDAKTSIRTRLHIRSLVVLASEPLPPRQRVADAAAVNHIGERQPFAVFFSNLDRPNLPPSEGFSRISASST